MNFRQRGNRIAARRSVLSGCGVLGCLILMSPGAEADRVVLSPDGYTLAPDAVKTEFVISPAKNLSNLGWVTVSSPQGIEMEAERLDLPTEAHKRYAFNLAYPVVPDFNGLPSVTVGVHDLLGTGTEHGAFYVAASRSFPLSNRQYRLVRDLKWNIGAGTSRLGGLFLGLQAQFAGGVRVYAEVYRRQPNFGIALPLVRNVQARAYSLDGDLYYGLSFAWRP